MRLKKLVLQNFMGIRELTVEAPEGKDISIYGANATGKTTVASAVSFLLFGKDHHGNAKFDIKTLDDNGQVIHNLEHGVQGTFEVGGKEVGLQKVYKEKWTNKRGSRTKEFTGHTTEHWIDGVPAMEKEYKAKVAEIAPPELFRLLTNPGYFPSVMPWQERRELLLTVCGDVSDQEVVETDDELSPLKDIIATRTIDDEKKVVAESMKKANAALKLIPARIDEARRLILEEPGDRAAEEKLVSSLNESLEACRADHAKVQAGDNTEQKRELAKLIDAVAEIEREFHRQKSADEAEADRRCYEAAKAVREMERAVEDERLALEKMRQRNVAGEINQQIASLGQEMADLRAKWEDLNPQQYAPGDCPTCGQAMPEDDQAEEAFNARKAERLAEIQAKGKEHKAEVERLEKEQATLVDKHAEETNAKAEALAQLEKQLADMKDAPAKIQQEIEAIRERKIEGLAEYQDAVKARDAAKRALDAKDNGPELERLNSKATKIKEDIAAAQSRLNEISADERARARVAELEAEERDLSKTWEDLAHKMFLMEQFGRKKVELLEGRVNNKFELARFKLFEDQVNGGLKDCCEVLGKDGVPYSTGLNNAGRVQVGLDIIKTLSRHYGVSLMCFVDNREAVTQLPEMDCQIISLVVSAEDDKLRIVAE